VNWPELVELSLGSLSEIVAIVLNVFRVVKGIMLYGSKERRWIGRGEEMS
jgi:hypothetical protein